MAGIRSRRGASTYSTTPTGCNRSSSSSSRPIFPMTKHGHPAAACRFKPIKRSLSRPSTHYYPRDGAGADLPEYRPGDGARNQTPHRGCPVAEVVWQCRAGGAAGGRIGQPGCVDLGNAVQRAADRLPDDLPDRQACENEGDTVQPPDPDGARPHQSAAGMPQGGK